MSLEELNEIKRDVDRYWNDPDLLDRDTAVSMLAKNLDRLVRMMIFEKEQDAKTKASR